MVEALFSEEAKEWLSLLPVGVVVMFDGIAVDPRLSLDTSQLPHKVCGVCRHCENTSFSSYEDYMALLKRLHAPDKDKSKVHVASECEVVVLGFIGDPNHTTIIPIAISLTCKRDYVLKRIYIFYKLLE